MYELFSLFWNKYQLERQIPNEKATKIQHFTQIFESFEEKFGMFK